MLPAGGLEAPLPGYLPATSWVHYTTSCNTQSSAPDDGRDHRPKHVELNEIINKPLLLHLVGVYINYNVALPVGSSMVITYLRLISINVALPVGSSVVITYLRLI